MEIMVALDLSDASESILARARILLQASEKVYLVHVGDPEPDFVGYDAGPQVVRDQVAHELQQERNALQAHASSLRDLGMDATALLLRGPIAATILSEARKLGVGMIVLGTHGRGRILDAVLGSVSLDLVRHSDIPVLLVPVDNSGDFEASRD